MYRNLDSQYQAGSVKTVTFGGIADHSNSYYRCVWGHGYNEIVVHILQTLFAATLADTKANGPLLAHSTHSHLTWIFLGGGITP